MATWVRNNSNSPSATDDSPEPFNTTVTLDNATAPGDFDPAAVNSVRIQYDLVITGISDDDWTDYQEAELGTTPLASVDGGDQNRAANGTFSKDITDNSPDNGQTEATWEAADLEVGTNGAWALWVKDKGPDGTTATVNNVTVTIDYTPTSGQSITGSAAFAPTLSFPTGTADLASFDIEQTDWRWYENDAATPTVSLAAENTKPTLPGDQNYVPVRLRVGIEEVGGAGSGPLSCILQWSEDGGTTWHALSAGANEDEHIYYGNGLGTDDAQIAGRVLSATDTSGDYHESASTQETWAASDHLEVDFAVHTRVFPPDVDVAFRVVVDGTPVAVQSGKSQIQLRGSTAASRELDGVTNTVNFMNNIGGSEPNSNRWAHRSRGFYDGARWWVFWNDVSSDTDIQYKNTDNLSNGWSASPATVSFTQNFDPDQFTVAFKDIGGTKYVLAVVYAGATDWRVKRGTISGSTISWSSEQTLTLPHNSDSNGSPSIVIDEGDFWWIVAKGNTTNNELWAARSTNTLDNATWETFNTEHTVSQSGLVGASPWDGPEAVSLASSEILVVYYDNGNTNLVARKCTESGGFGSPTTINSTTDAHDTDWGVSEVATDGDIYCLYGDQTGNGYNMLLAVYDVAGDSWSAGTDPSIDKSTDATANDGIMAHAGDDGVIRALYSINEDSSRDTRIASAEYSGGTSGTWSNVRTLIHSGPIGNSDAQGILMDGANALVLTERGDDGLSDTFYVLEYYWVTSTGDLTVTGGAAFTPSLSFPTGSVDLIVTGGAAFTPALSFPTGSLSQLVVGGAAFTPTLSFPQGSVDLTLLGQTFTPSLSFPQGNAANRQTLSGAAAFTPGLTFPQGSVDLTLTGGAAFAPSLSFPTGTVQATNDLVGGAAFAPTLSFPTGSVDLTIAGGAAFTPGLSFPTGQAIQEQFLTGGAAFAPSLTFPQGSVDFSLMGGAAFAPALSFPQGSIDLTVTGAAAFAPALSFPQGNVDQAGTQTLTGSAAFASSLTFPTGSIDLTLVGQTFNPSLSFPTGAALQEQLLTGGAALTPGLSFPTGSVDLTLTGAAAFAPSLSFPIGSVDLTLLGQTFTPTLSFPTGTADQAGTQTVTGGAAFAPSLSFPTGSVDLTPLGVVFAPVLTFPQGNAANRQTLVGAVFAPALAFPQGSVDLVLVGAVFAPSLSFPTGQIDLTILGAVFAPSLTFPQGNVDAGAVTQTLTGSAAFTPSLSFPTGSVDLTLLGQTFAPALSFPQGDLSQDQALVGAAAFTPTLSFPQGSVDLFIQGAAAFTPTLVFPTGTVDLIISGATFTPTLVFAQGNVAQDQMVVGPAVFAPTLLFPTGTVSAVAPVGYSGTVTVRGRDRASVADRSRVTVRGRDRITVD